MVVVALHKTLYKVQSWITGTYFEEFSCYGIFFFFGLARMNCSNSVGFDIITSVCMTAVSFPFWATSPLAILQLSDFLSHNVPSCI